MGGFYIGPGGRGIESWEMDQILTFPLFAIGCVVELDTVQSGGQSGLFSFGTVALMGWIYRSRSSLNQWNHPRLGLLVHLRYPLETRGGRFRL
jgi:hypothetical protein